MTETVPEGWVDKYFEEIEVGSTYVLEDARTITETDVMNYAGVSGDFAPVHISKPEGEATRYNKRIVHGNLVKDISEALVLEKNIRGITSYGHDNIRFTHAVFIGDTLSVKREVIDKEIHDEESGKVVYRYTATNQDGDVVCIDDHIALVERN